MSGMSTKTAKDYAKITQKELEEAYKKALGGASTAPSSGSVSSPLRSLPPVPTYEMLQNKDVILNKLLNYCLDNDLWIKKTGSQLIEGIIPNDYDFVVEAIGEDAEKFRGFLQDNGYNFGGSNAPESQFESYKIYTRNKPINVILCTNRDFFKKYLMATELLKKIQPKTKQERIDLFDTVFGRNEPKQVPF